MGNIYERCSFLYANIWEIVYRNYLVRLLLLVLCAFPYVVKAQQKNKSEEKISQIVWDNKVLELENVDSKKDKVLIVEFPFTVKGEVPIVIHNVKANCGCTKVEWSKKPVMPDERSKIVIHFQTKGEKGYFDKRFIVESTSVKNVELLRFRGKIK